MNKKLEKVLKILISSAAAFFLLTLFCSVYYNVPIHSSTKDGATDYSWESNKKYSSMIEGYGTGKTNNEGYMNTYDYDENTHVDVLIMGSSHLQGLQIDIKDNCSTLLNEMLENKVVYNIAIAGHNIKTCICNLDAALYKYKPEIVVIETSKIELTKEEINATINGEIKEIASNENPIIKTLQKNPLLRLLYNQYENFKSNSLVQELDEKNDSYFDENDTNNLLKYINDVCYKYNAKPIIVFHPTVSITNEELIVNRDVETSNIFSKLCKKNNITYIDMSDTYLQEYNDNHIAPTGFNNTGVGVGHINKYAHKMFADELYIAIKEID